MEHIRIYNFTQRLFYDQKMCHDFDFDPRSFGQVQGH